MQRRQFVKSALTLAAVSLIGTGTHARQTLISGARDASGSYSIRIFDAYKKHTTRIAIPERLHDATRRPGSNEIAIFARRPGYRFYVVDWHRSQISYSVVPAHSRHFYGHGVFSANGDRLYTTENNLDSLQGVIGIYDPSQGYKRVGEWALGAPGPHEVKLLPDGETLVVAVGGIKTDPDSGRKKLNPDSMQPSLLYLNRHTGHIIDQQTFIDPRLSIRHLDVDLEGNVAIGMQYQGNNAEALPLIAVHRQGEPIRAVQALPEQWLGLNGYISSVKILPDTIAATAAKGNRIVLIEKSTTVLKSLIYHRDCAGLAPLGERRLAVSNGLGEVKLLECFKGQATKIEVTQQANCSWDNHLLNPDVS